MLIIMTLMMINTMKLKSAPMHYEIDVCGNLINYNYVGEIDESDYMTTTFGIALKEIKQHYRIWFRSGL